MVRRNYEGEFRTYAMPVSVVRPFNTYGPREPWQGARAEVIPRFILRLRAGREPVVYGDGRQTRDFTYVDDVVDALVCASRAGGPLDGPINIGSGERTSILTLAETIAAAVGRPLDVAHTPPRPGDVRDSLAGVERARELLDWRAGTSLADGIRATLAAQTERVFQVPRANQ